MNVYRESQHDKEIAQGDSDQIKPALSVLASNKAESLMHLPLIIRGAPIRIGPSLNTAAKVSFDENVFILPTESERIVKESEKEKEPRACEKKCPGKQTRL